MANSEKAKSKSVSFPPGLWEKVEAKAAKRYGANRSAYLRVLAEADLENDGLPVRSDDAGMEMARLAELCHESGIDPVIFFRSVMLKVLQYAEENDGRLILPIRIESPNSDLKKGALALKRFEEILGDNFARRLREAAAQHRPFAEIVESLTSGDPELMELARRAYVFLTPPGYPLPREEDALKAAQDQIGRPQPKRILKSKLRLGDKEESKAG